MDIYEDYQRYIEDNQLLLTNLKSKASSAYVLLDDILEVLNWMVKEHNKKTKLEPELDEFFEIGFGYVTSLINEMQIMFKDYFHEDTKYLEMYDTAILYFFYLDDLRCHLLANEILTKEKQELVESALKEIEDILAGKMPYNVSYPEKYEAIINELEEETSFKPVYAIFSRLREELNLI